jgi:aminoglycoside 6-adenylyltransferase
MDKLVNWGKSSDKLSAVIIIGSHAREDHGADEYSDLDVILFVNDTDYFLSSDQWLNNIGIFHVSFTENTICGGKERRVLFNGALDVDFLIFPIDKINSFFSSSEGAAFLERGYRILVDKAGLQPAISQKNTVKQSNIPSSERHFLNITNDFWYHSVWTAKKLKRGELWTAKYCVDTYMKGKLLTVIEYHTHAIKGVDCDTWHNGRFIEEWAETWIIEKLSRCFSHYDKEDIKKSLLCTMDLFRLIAVEVAKKLNFQYPDEADAYAAKWIKSILQD